MNKFVSLHTHSEFSTLDGVGSSEMLAKQAAELGHKALAITDHGTLAGALYHLQACEEVGIKPIIGEEFYFRNNILKDREEKNNRGYFHIVLLAKNEEGFRNLMRMSSLSYQEINFYQKPCIDWNILEKYSEGVIGSSSCLSGVIPDLICRGDIETAEVNIDKFLNIFGDNFYLEIQPHNIEEQKLVNMEICNLFNSKGVALVAAADVHYPYKEWNDTQDVLLMIATGQTKNKREREEAEGKGYLSFAENTFFLMSDEEIMQLFKDNHSGIPDVYIENAISNCSDVADWCEHISIDKSPKIPRAAKSTLEERRILQEWINAGLERIGKSDDPIYLARVKEELDVLTKLKVLPYFVLVGDAVRWAKKNNIRVGAARGSAGGCLINYLIGIIALDPIGYDLLFERFLNEYRTELPDIDIDFQDDRRDEVRDYLVEKYGKDHVVDVASYQSFGLRSVVQDISRVLSIPFMEVKRATDSIPDKTFGETIESLEQSVSELNSFFQKYPDVRSHAIRLQGQIKGHSRHAAAVIVTDKPAQDLIPMARAKDGGIVTQWTERANAQLLSPNGFLKIDLLSTDGLTIQQKCIELIKERHGVTVDFEDNQQFKVNESPDYAESQVIQFFGKGMNLGIFQFASSGIGGLLKEIKPTHLNHIIAANALYRPGTIANGMTREYAWRKNGKTWTLPSDKIEPFLRKSYGILCYQEQVVQIVKELGKDFGSAEAAAFLKVVSKGIARDLEGKQKLQKYEKQFKDGCKEKDMNDSETDKVWNEILDLTIYCFNLAHASGYALQAYQDMWLKVNYPMEFYTSLLSIESDSVKISRIIREMKLWGLNASAPDVNTSERGFSINGNTIRYGLRAIKGLGEVAAREIINNRPYESYEDFLEKTPTNKVNKKIKMALLNSGALDCWGARTEWILDDVCDKIPGVQQIDEQVKYEEELLGVSLSRISDLEQYRKILEDRIVKSDVLRDMDDEEVVLGGEIIKVKEHKTKNGEVMAFLDLSFDDNEYNVTLWPEKYNKYKQYIREGNVVLIKGMWDSKRGNTIANNICTAAQLAGETK